MKSELTPFWYAVGSFFFVPFAVIMLAVAAAALLTIWPAIPVLFYLERRNERRNENEK